MSLSLKQIEYFRAVVETGSISGAAALLNVSQPNVSRIVKHTESRLGLRLFQRTKGRLQPTPEALELFREVQLLHARLELLQDAVQRIATGENRRFVVGASPSLGRSVIPSLLAPLRATFPSLTVKLDILSVAQVVEYVAFGEGECACTLFPIDHPQLVSDVHASGRLVCAVPAGHPLASRASLDASDLTGEDLIGFEPATPHGRIVEAVFARAGTQPRFRSIVRFAESACALAEYGNGVALVDEFTMAGNAFPALRAIPVTAGRPFRVHLHRSARRPLSVVGERFRQLLAAWTRAPASSDAAAPRARADAPDGAKRTDQGVRRVASGAVLSGRRYVR